MLSETALDNVARAVRSLTVVSDRFAYAFDISGT